MRSVCISAQILGSNQNLIITENDSFWSKEIPFESIVLGVKSNNNDLNALARLSGKLNLDVLPNDHHVRAFRTIVSNDLLALPPWKLLLNDRQYTEFVEKITIQVRSILKTAAFDYFDSAWVIGNKVLDRLERACIDTAILDQILDLNAGNIPAVQTFEPLNDGLTPKVVYDRFGARTGRMTIQEGPHILTLKKEHRAMLKPSSEDNVLLNIDFSAMEARVVLYEHGGHCDDVDLYGKIALELNLPRNVVKGSVIAELYGMSKHALAAKLGLEKRVVFNYMKDLDAQFRVSELKSRLRSQYNELGYVKNRYGRCILIDDPLDHILLNYYTQSSAVDVAMYGFNSILTSYSDMKLLFLVHDAMIVEVPIKLYDSMEKILKVKVPGYVSTFPLKVELLNPLQMNIFPKTC